MSDNDEKLPNLHWVPKKVFLISYPKYGTLSINLEIFLFCLQLSKKSVCKKCESSNAVCTFYAHLKNWQ